nr:hypothetical protein [Mycoplasmopsis bovis]
MGDFQARRAMIRYRDENNEVQFAHTMNGSGLAIESIWLRSMFYLMMN